MASYSGADDVSYCLTCDAGYGCRVPNTRMDCSAGFYCMAGAFTSRPNNLAADSENGGMCVPGEYCTNGLSAAVSCPAGSYCPNYASNLQVACPAGYYCPTTGTRGD